jgi:hypothetical protein
LDLHSRALISAQSAIFSLFYLSAKWGFGQMPFSAERASDQKKLVRVKYLGQE